MVVDDVTDATVEESINVRPYRYEAEYPFFHLSEFGIPCVLHAAGHTYG